MLLNKHNLNLAKLTAKEESRYTINGVLISPTETIVADGHLATILNVPDLEIEGADPVFPFIEGFTPAKRDFEPFILSRNDCLDLVKRIPKSPTIPVLENVALGQGPNGKASFAVTDLDRDQIISVRTIQGQFPNVKQCFPTPDDAKAVVTVDAHLLIGVLTQYRELNPDKPYVCLRVYDSKTPIRMDAVCDGTGQRMTSILMPEDGLADPTQDK